MVTEDYLGLNNQLVLGVSHSKLLNVLTDCNGEVLFSNYNEFIQLVAFETFGYI